MDKIIPQLRLEDQEALHALPVGTIALDISGQILFYNRAESLLSGFDPKDVVGKNFFHEVAPCTRVQEFYGAFVAGVARGELRHKFYFCFRFKDRPHLDVQIVLFYSTETKIVWVLVQPKDPSGDPLTTS